MKLKWILLFSLITVQAHAAGVLVTECAPQAERFIPQPPIAAPAETFRPTVPTVTRSTFQPYVPRVNTAPRPDQPVYTAEATRFTPDPRFQPNRPYVSPADHEPDAQRFIPTPQYLPEVERVQPCLCQ